MKSIEKQIELKKEELEEMGLMNTSIMDKRTFAVFVQTIDKIQAELALLKKKL